MNGYFTYPDAQEATDASAPARARRIAVVTQGVKLGEEQRGYVRFRVIAEMLAEAGFEVTLLTSSFQHWDKAQRNTSDPSYLEAPYSIEFIEEPGYSKNLDLARIMSHRTLAKNLRSYFEKRFAADPKAFDLIYSEIPPNDMARVCAETAQQHGIPYVADVNDLWPEAMRMVVNVPVVSDVAFYPFARDAKATYELITAAVGTSDEYAARPALDRKQPYRHITVYVGNNLKTFDDGAQERSAEVEKPDGEFWVMYTGTLGASYDLATLVKAANICSQEDPRIRVKILGDGPDHEALEALAQSTGAPVEFVGYAPYDLMAAYLAKSDITVNSLVKKAPQSIVTKIGDYLAAGKPLINTGSSPEFRMKVVADGFGVNVEAEDEDVLARAILDLAGDPEQCRQMGAIARKVAEEQFDQRTAYKAIVELVRSLT